MSRFYVCPWCSYKRPEGFTGVEFRYDLGELWLTDESVVEHRHVGVGLPDPARLNLGPEGGRLYLKNLDTGT